MRESTYEKYFTEEELSRLKASEVRKLQVEEDALTGLMLIVMAGSFITFVLLVALILWSNTLTLFLFTVFLLPTIFIYVFVIKSTTGFKKNIDKYKKAVENREVK